MRRYSFLFIILVAGLLLIRHQALTSAYQESASIPQGATGVTGIVLGAMQPAVAPGHELQVFRSVWEPGSSISLHMHPGALVSCVESGVLTFEIEDGSATVIRAHPNTSIPVEIARAHPDGGPEAITPGEPITYGPGDCVAFDEEAAHTLHTAWNAGDEPVVLWEAHLYKTGERATTFVEAATPAP